MSTIYSLSQDWSVTYAGGDGLNAVKRCFEIPAYAVAPDDDSVRLFCADLYDDGMLSAEDYINSMIDAGIDHKTAGVLANAWIARKQAPIVSWEPVSVELTVEAERYLSEILDEIGAVSVSTLIDWLYEQDADKDDPDEFASGEIYTALQQYKY